MKKSRICLILPLLFSLYAVGLAQSSAPQISHDAELAYARQQFMKNFRDLQLISKELLKEHEAARLTPGQLEKDAKSINKCAKTLRTLGALGEIPSGGVEIEKDIKTAGQFDEAIRKLVNLISDYVHNPIHQNDKVYDTNLARSAKTDLLAIINLSKTLENKSKRYVGHIFQ